MPTYNFNNIDTNETFSEFLTISEMEQKLKEHPNLSLVPASPLIHSGRGLKKPEEGFRDLLKDMKKKHYKSTINTF